MTKSVYVVMVVDDTLGLKNYRTTPVDHLKQTVTVKTLLKLLSQQIPDLLFERLQGMETVML
jgi:hypothetical protein